MDLKSLPSVLWSVIEFETSDSLAQDDTMSLGSEESVDLFVYGERPEESQLQQKQQEAQEQRSKSLVSNKAQVDEHSEGRHGEGEAKEKGEAEGEQKEIRSRSKPAPRQRPISKERNLSRNERRDSALFKAVKKPVHFVQSFLRKSKPRRLDNRRPSKQQLRSPSLKEIVARLLEQPEGENALEQQGDNEVQRNDSRKSQPRKRAVGEQMKRLQPGHQLQQKRANSVGLAFQKRRSSVRRPQDLGTPSVDHRMAPPTGEASAPENQQMRSRSSAEKPLRERGGTYMTYWTTLSSITSGNELSV